jgi:hypothetical protein
LANVALIVADPPVAPLVAAKKSVVGGELRVSVVVPVLVVLFPNWSSSWRPSAMLVVALAVADDGLGVMATWVAVPPVMVTLVVPHEAVPFLAVMVGVAAVSSP